MHCKGLMKPRAYAVLVLVSLFSLVGVGCGAAPEGGETVGDESLGVTAQPITKEDAVSRAMEWVDVKLKYCQAPNHAPDYDAACSSVCNRKDNKKWNPYRSDCSGLVSWAWGLPAPGLTTLGFAPYS